MGDDKTSVERNDSNIGRNGKPLSINKNKIDYNTSALLQCCIIRDNTYSVDNSLLGSRDLLLIYQGLGFSRKLPLFSRHMITSARILKAPKCIPVPQVIIKKISLAISVKAGNCLGNYSASDEFILGG